MNVAIFTNNYLPNTYGVSMSIETFRWELEKQGHAVYIFAPHFKGYADKNPNVFRYPAIDIEFKIKFPLAIPYSWKIGKILKKLDIDIIHSQHPNLLGSAAMKWSRRLARRRDGKKVPLVFTWHTLYDQYAHFASIIPEKWVAGYIIKKAVRYANQADAVVVPTDSIIPILRQWGVNNENITPVASGVVEEEFENFDRGVVRKKYGITDDEIMLFMNSRLTAEKNVEFVLESLLTVLENNEKVKFLVISDGYLESRLRRICEINKISQKVFFAGLISRQEIKNYYAAADIFVYGSKSETQGMVITEAMYMGLPIVAVNATGISSLVLNKGNGYLVSEDKREFSESVQKLIDDRELRQKFGETSKRIARMQFTSGISAEKMLGVYRKCLNH